MSRVSRTEKTIVAYDGPELANGMMDVRDLAPALLAIGQVCRDANRLLNTDRIEVSVRVESQFTKGSFEVVLHLAQTLPQVVRDLLTPTGMTVHDAKELLELIGLWAGGSITIPVSVIKLIRFLKGLKPKSVEPAGPDRVKVENHFGESIIVNNGTMLLFGDDGIRSELQKIMRPLEKQDIDTFEVRDPKTKAVVEKVTKADVAYYKSSAATSMPTSKGSLIFESQTSGIFQIVSPVFREDNKWKLSNGQSDFWAEVGDKDFMDRVHRHVQVFGEGDLLRCRYETRSWREGSKLVTEIVITKVEEVIPPDTATQAEPLLQLPPSN